jgi:hypothetical protein
MVFVLACGLPAVFFLVLAVSDDSDKLAAGELAALLILFEAVPGAVLATIAWPWATPGHRPGERSRRDW